MNRFEQLAKVLYLSPEEVAQRLELLSESEREILILRFGLNDGVIRTLEETAETCKVTRERVRQIEGMAINRIRHHKSPTD